MKIYSIAIGVVSVLILSGCAPKVITLQNKFDAEATRSLFSKEGNNTISGNGFIRQKNGGVVTCAGSKVSLVSKTAYSTERFRFIYGNAQRGYRMNFMGAQPMANIAFSENPPEYFNLMRYEICDSQGNFTFNKVADGEYFVATGVSWMVNQYALDGGIMMQYSNVSSGETKKIILTP